MLIAVEGIDAAGKNTQATLLRQRIEGFGLTAEILSFPRYYDTLFGATIADYLNGKFGDLHSVDPHLSSLLYAGDRFESRRIIQDLSRSRDLLIVDRYVSSNLAYQSARVDLAVRQEFIAWLARIEYEVYGLPRADVTLYLDVPAEIASRMLRLKAERSYTTKVADLYERDVGYLAACRGVYQGLCSMNFESHWLSIQCSHSGLMLEMAEISALIWTGLEPVVRSAFELPNRPAD
jgi:dTMP kinase